MFQFIFLAILGIGLAVPTVQANDLEQVIIHFSNEGYAATTIPWIKEYLAQEKNSSKKVDEIIEKIFWSENIKALETLPIEFLQKSRSSVSKYIVAKKLLFSGKIDRSIDLLKNFDDDSKLYPFSLNILAHAYSILGKYDLAYQVFDQCISKSQAWKKEKNEFERKQLEMNHDYCVMGIARTKFAQRDFDQAEEGYLDILKNSYVWPETLMEEAWNSYYLKKYNRSLGKLVTYNVPILDFIFNPEIEVLQALNFYRMCLYDDATLVIESFYSKNQSIKAKIETLLADKGSDYSSYAKLALLARRNEGDTGLLSVLKSIAREPSFESTVASFEIGQQEKKRIEDLKDSKTKRVLLSNVNEFLSTQLKIMGGFARKRLMVKVSEIERAMKSMTYIKLDILSKKKELLYQDSPVEPNGKRGKVEYLEKSNKQYFWTFDGEFWADELGDYVFALKKECKE